MSFIENTNLKYKTRQSLGSCGSIHLTNNEDNDRDYNLALLDEITLNLCMLQLLLRIALNYINVLNIIHINTRSIRNIYDARYLSIDTTTPNSTSLSEALPTTTIDTVAEFTRRSATGNCK